MLSRSLSASPFRSGVRLASSTASQLKINKVEASQDKKKLNINWEDGTSGSLPFAWLRDVDTDHKLLHLNELSMEVRPESFSVDTLGQQLTIQWPPYDVSRYTTQWLWDHAAAASTVGVPPSAAVATPWGQGAAVPELSNDLKAEAARFKSAFETHGVVKIKAGHNLAEGDFIHLLGLQGATSLGQSEKSLAKAYPMSTQHPAYAELPRVHTVKALRAGLGSLMVADGFHIAHHFQSAHPELFEFAAARAIQYARNGDTAGRPIFNLASRDGAIKAVCFNNPMRMRDVLLPQRAQELVYKSLKVFNKILMKSYVDVPLSEGDILVVDNARILSGNASIAPIQGKPTPLFRLSTFGTADED